MELLIAAAKELAPNTDDKNESTMFQYYSELTFMQLNRNNDVHKHQIAELESVYFQLLQYSRHRPPKYLHTAMSEDPDFFLKILCLAY